MRSYSLRAGLVGNVDRLEDAFDLLEQSASASAIATLERPDITLASALYEIDPKQGDGYWELLRLGKDVFAIITNVTYRKRLILPIVGEDLIEFHFRLSGACLLIDGASSIDVSRDSLLIWRQPRGCDIVEHLYSNGEREVSVTIYCRPSFLTRCFGQFHTQIDDQLAQLLAPDSDRIQSLRSALYPHLKKMVVELAAVTDRTGFRLAVDEALVIQIIGHLLSNIDLQKRNDRLEALLSDRDMECLRLARSLVLREYAPPPKIDDIARRVGLSRTKLKAGFRAVYGETITGFANELRMNMAKDMLHKADKPIAHVSAALGYEYQNSFTVAFRRRFGVLPKDYRRDPLAHNRSV